MKVVTSSSESLYQVFTLTATAYTETLFKDRSPPDSPSDNLYRVFILMAKAYTETLLKDESPPTAALTAYIEFSP